MDIATHLSRTKLEKYCRNASAQQSSALPWRVRIFVSHEGEHPKVVGPILTHLHDVNPEENAKEAVKAELRKLCKQAPGEAPTNLVSDARGSMDNLDYRGCQPTDRFQKSPGEGLSAHVS